MSGPRKRHGRGPGSHRGGPGGRDGRERTRRGTAGRSALVLLAERPMHGYEIIAELEERTDGNWRPSPGSIYPALARLEERGLIEGTDDSTGKRQYALTDAGRQRIAEADPDAPPPWTEAAKASRGGELRNVMAELEGQARQIGRFGSDEQRAGALEALGEARRKLYAILAE